MSFRSIDDIADDLMAALPAATFKDIRKCNVTDYKLLLSVIPELTLLPGAIVCAGPHDFTDGGFTRIDDIAIVIIDKFRGSVAAKASGSWAALEAADSIFPSDGSALAINGVYYLRESARPVKIDGKTAYIIQIKAHQ